MKPFEVGISTRDRWVSLEKTILKCRAFWGFDFVIRVAIDGSSVPEHVTRVLIENDVRVYIHVDRQGYIVRRNELAGLCQARYYLSLDDDSYPLSGDIGPAILYMDNNIDIAVIGFQIMRPDGTCQVSSRLDIPYQTRAYVGCAHILRVDLFNELGGYDVSLVHQGEEIHYGALVLINGCKCMHYPSVTVMHEATIVARSNYRIGFYAARNKILWAYDYCPNLWVMLKKIIRVIGEQVIHAIIEISFARIMGLLNGFSVSFFSRRKRIRMNGAIYSQYAQLKYF